MGNTRVLFTDTDNNGAPEMKEEYHYYPFGMRMEGWPAGTGNYRYQYNGKEVNTDFGLHWVDYGARWYDAGIGRWNAVDPLAEHYHQFTTHSYVLNNPLIYLDPDGMRIDVSEILRKDAKGRYRHADLAQAFLMFAKSELGIKILSNFAQKGQTIAGHTYNESGNFHNQGIDINFSVAPLNSGDSDGYKTQYGANGVTQFKETEGPRASITVFLNSELNSNSNEYAEKYEDNPKDEQARLLYQLSRMATLFHETIIHGENMAADFSDDCRLNCSNIKNHYGKNPKNPKERTYIQHKAARSPQSRFVQAGISAIISIHKKYKSGLTEEKIKRDVLSFSD